MFGIGTPEILVILVVALIVVGPEKLPKFARTIGKTLGDFRRVSTDFQRTLNTEIAFEEHSQRKKEAEKELFPEENEQEEDLTAVKKSDENTSDIHEDKSSEKVEKQISSKDNSTLEEKV